MLKVRRGNTLAGIYEMVYPIILPSIRYSFTCLLTTIQLLVQIGEFDWLSGRQKGSIFVKMFKNLLLRNHIGDEAETWHTCLGH